MERSWDIKVLLTHKLDQSGVILNQVLSDNTEEAGLTAFSALSHQGVIKVIWLHFWAMSIYIYKHTDCDRDHRHFNICVDINIISAKKAT